MEKIKIKVKLKENKPTNQNKERGKISQASILSFISVFISALAIMVSIYTYYDNKKLNENIRYESEIIQRVEETRMLSFDTNIEFWDYSIAEIMQDIIDSNGLSKELSNISLSIADKQTGAALQMLLDNKEWLDSDERYHLLLACLYTRDCILDSEYILDYFNRGKTIDECALTDNFNVEEEKYYITQGVLAYYAGNLADSVHYLRMALNIYSKDSPFYDVANYWLAILAVRLRSNICDTDVFLNSSYNENALLNVLKSSVSFLFCGRDRERMGISPTFVQVYDTCGEWANGYMLPFMMDNPASYLDAEDSENFSQWGWWRSQKRLYLLYSMLFNYTEQLHYQSTICLAKFGEESYKEFFELLEGFEPKEIYFIDPRLSEEEFIKSFTDWYLLFFSAFRYNDIDLLVPTDEIFDRLAYLASIHSSSDTDYSIFVYNKAFEYCQAAYNNSDDGDFQKGCYATLALKYSAYNSSDIEFNEYDAAKCAYEYGYRYGYIFDSLINYYENEGGSSNANKVSLLRTERGKLHV